MVGDVFKFVCLPIKSFLTLCSYVNHGITGLKICSKCLNIFTLYDKIVFRQHVLSSTKNTIFANVSGTLMFLLTVLFGCLNGDIRNG